MLAWILLLGCFTDTRNCSDGGLRGVFPESDDVLPATDTLAALVGYGGASTGCGLDGWDTATYVVHGSQSGVLASGDVGLSWPGDVFWVSLSAAPAHEETVRLHVNEADTAEPPIWEATVDTGWQLDPAIPTSVSLETSSVSSQVVGGRTYVSLLGTGTADVELSGLLVQTVSSDTLYGPEDQASSGESLLKSNTASGTDFVWNTGEVGVEDGATELCLSVRFVDVDQTVRFQGDEVCVSF